MPTVNNTNSTVIARANCACCAFGALFNLSAHDVMTQIYGMLGRNVPSGSSQENAGDDAFAIIWMEAHNEQPGTGLHLLEQQLGGVVQMLQHKGVQCTQLGTVQQPLTKWQAIQTVRRLPEGTRFLCLTGENMGAGMALQPHWTYSQVEDGVGMYYDYQLNTTDPHVTDQLNYAHQRTLDFRARLRHRPQDNLWGRPLVSMEPLGPLGQRLDDDQGRAVVLQIH